MPGVPESFLRGLDELPPRFTRQEAVAAFDTLRESSVTVYLSHLAKSGHLKRVGPKEFEKAAPTATSSLDPMSSQLVHSLKPTMLQSSLTRLVIWSSEALAPFVHDAILQPFVFLQGPNEYLPTIKDKLTPEWNILEPTGGHGLGNPAWKQHVARTDRPDLFLRHNTDLRGTIQTVEGPRTPTLERLFIETLLLGPSDPQILLTMLESPTFDPDEALRTAGARGDTAKVSSFLTWAALHHPGLPMAKRLKQRFSHLRMEA